MASIEKNLWERNYIVWEIENFQFCWHKTGERLESPLFHTDFPIQTSWRLWLYPRGEDDAEYVSFYLVREEGGPEAIDVDFNLILSDKKSGESYHKILLNWYSFKIHQREGLKCFVPRLEIFPPMADPNVNRVLCLGCEMFNRKPEGLYNYEQFLKTSIEMECIRDIEIFEDTKDDSPHNRDINVVSLFEAQPLININVSCIEDSIVIKIIPVNCKKIKYAVCNITVIKSWGQEPPIEHSRSWIGDIKADVWRYRFLSSVKPFYIKALYVRYGFVFSTGKKKSKCEREDSGYSSFQQYLCVKPAKSAPTALDALRNNYISQSFVDTYVVWKTNFFQTHKALFCVRCPIFKLSIQDNSAHIDFSFYEDFDSINSLFMFLYTDTLQNPSFSTSLCLYRLSHLICCHSLKKLCRSFVLGNMNHLSHAPVILLYAAFHQDPIFVTAIHNYIMKNYELIISATKWESLENIPDFRKEVILLKYKKQKSEISELCRTMRPR